MAVKGILVGVFLIACWAAVTRSTLHASCKLTWSFTVPCGTVHDLIVKQMNVWNTSAPCPPGTEKCKYKITSDTTSEIKGTHTTPVHDYVDDLSMELSGTANSCSVKGYSTSEIWYAVLDKGTNYCNLHNLVVGSGLTNTTRYGFKETTDDGVCTEYSSANCSKY